MQKLKNNYAFIDAQNLYLAINELGWKLDYKKFRIYLKEKYGVGKAYMFMGFVSANQKLYVFLRRVGFVLIFKPTFASDDVRIKGNCDAELVLQAMIDLENYDKAVIVTGDGDFYCLVKYLNDHNKLLRVLAPSLNNCSFLITRITSNDKTSFVSQLREKLEYKKKRTP